MKMRPSSSNYPTMIVDVFHQSVHVRTTQKNREKGRKSDFYSCKSSPVRTTMLSSPCKKILNMYSLPPMVIIIIQMVMPMFNFLFNYLARKVVILHFFCMTTLTFLL